MLGDVVFGIDEESMETVVLNMLGERSMSLAIAEGLTGGVMAARLSEIDQRMAIFRGGTVATEIENHNVDGQTAGSTAAIQARQTFGTDIGLAVATARPQDEQPRATVYVCLDINGASHKQTVSLPGDRNRFRNYAVINALNFLRRTLMGR